MVPPVLSRPAAETATSAHTVTSNERRTYNRWIRSVAPSPRELGLSA